jgi:hypothetical protein
MRLFKVILAMLFVAALAGCAKPLPPEKTAYAGHWSGPSVELLITEDGRVDYSRVNGARSTSVKAPVKEFAGDNMVVGVGPMSTTFVVSAPPHQVGDAWKMTVDGVELIKK